MGRKRKLPTKFVTDWSFDAEIGDFCIYRGNVCRLEASSGRNQRDAGILYPRKIRVATEEDILHARKCQDEYYKNKKIERPFTIPVK